MIHIKDAKILDILPHIFKTAEYTALSEAIAALTRYFYNKMSGVLFFADIENADEVLLDAMAAELDAPFYFTDMTPEQKRSVIASAFVNNSRAGTKAAVERLIKTSFGGGEVSEWFEYGGEPYHFKISLIQDEAHTEIEDFNYFVKTIGKVKNKRSKLEEIIISYKSPIPYPIRIGGAVSESAYERVGTAYAETGCEAADIAVYGGGAFMENIYECVQRRRNTFGDLKAKTYGDLKNKTYADISEGRL